MSDTIDIEPATGVTPNGLELVIQKSGLNSEYALQIRTGFSDFLAQATDWRTKVAGVTDAKIAGDSRKALKKIRIAADKRRVDLKKQVAVVGTAIQSAYDLIEGITSPLELQLESIEKAAEKAEQIRKDALKAERLAALAPYGVDVEFIILEELTNEKFSKLLSDSRLLFETKAAAESKVAEEKRIADEKLAAEIKAREEASALENERIRIENDRLKRERETAAMKAKEEDEKRELAIQAERAAAEKDRLAAQLEIDNARAAEALAKKRADEAAAASLAALEAQKKASDEKIRLAQEEARKAQEELIAKANKERLEHEAALKAANDAKAKLEAEQKALVAAQQTHAAAAEQAKTAANDASNTEKLHLLAEDIRSITVPDLIGGNGPAVKVEIINQIDLFAKWIIKKTNSL